MLVKSLDDYNVELLRGITEWLRENYQFSVLTGEACALSMRMLVELKDAEITRLYQEFLGIYFDIDKRGFGNTVFMTWQMIEEFAIFVACNEYGLVTKLTHNEFKGEHYWMLWENASDFYTWQRDASDAGITNKLIWNGDRYEAVHGTWNLGRTYTTGSNPRRGMSNVHTMTGISQ